MRYRFLVNPSAGLRRLDRTLRGLRRHFNGPGAEILTLSGPGHAAQLAAESAAQGHHAVVVVGGDGTLNEAVGGLMRAPAPRGLSPCPTRLGLVPAGTGNGFARGLGIPLDMDAACRVLLRDVARPVDVGVAASREGSFYFVNLMGVGYDAWIAHKANQLRGLGKVHGLGRYVAAGLVSLARYRPAKVRVAWPGGALNRPTTLLALANGEQYGFDARIAPGADPSDGSLDLVHVPPLSPWQMARHLPALFAGERLPMAAYQRVASATLDHEGGDWVPFHVDGEPAGTLPASVRVLRRRLWVVAPEARPKP